MTGPDDYFRFRWDIERSMRDARGVITEVEREFAERFGRSYGPVEEYRCEGADVVVIAMGTLGKEAEVAIDLLRDEGIKAGPCACAGSGPSRTSTLPGGRSW
ncbi:protein of unknown function [Methanoculleus bourgensis]|uniref:Pyruvate:ferredoxin oxidoreductase core domain-containing protein n=1 Tax=Methanoculleus bourgensis TaxID=83986 RepID=A0A0X3BLX4_9EURY|nr:protein of unknown function [Methanoculleus bourgensis]